MTGLSQNQNNKLPSHEMGSTVQITTVRITTVWNYCKAVTIVLDYLSNTFKLVVKTNAK
jgi:hypothetical protein